jgi:hypothetical protein
VAGLFAGKPATGPEFGPVLSRLGPQLCAGYDTGKKMVNTPSACLHHWLLFGYLSCRIECGKGGKNIILVRNFPENVYLMRHNAAIRQLTETLRVALGWSQVLGSMLRHHRDWMIFMQLVKARTQQNTEQKNKCLLLCTWRMGKLPQIVGGTL